MQGFEYYTPTKVVFGKDTENRAGELVKEQKGTKVLVHYGTGSVKKSGLLDRVLASLDKEGVPHVELGGAVPNPRLSLVSLVFIPIVGLSSGVFYRKISRRFQAADEAEGRSEREGRGEGLQDRLEKTRYRFICVEFSGGSVRSVLLDQNRGGGVAAPKEPVSWELLEQEVDAYTETSLIYTASYADGSYYLGRGSVTAVGNGELFGFRAR